MAQLSVGTTLAAGSDSRQCHGDSCVFAAGCQEQKIEE
ncbi:Uncharacterized protein AC518_0121 [Pseudomonas syringae pv. syringae]|uniref:Uncharacterized protein n=2 Tax=Pseudomonas syringae group TaxID=136849 RepID=A0A3M5X6A3_9PSED|nr:hypothetical protein PSYAR_00185 [Pseudomonas syringae pv. aceris str. M302273]KOG04746.1 Uncharacterized protein ABJ98_4186 [Pseudomonas syringae pv. aceris]KPB19140.1 Uncharacterized protein AC518_0121 [Pseudomonas syringae pv. syringae]RMU77424.1 hypothetical protein ALP23_101739 [Pseudomonas syringae pv. apii]KPW08003.1 hypothetical protein ALO91_102344 [Pseudomonas syringae pv. aceris]